jgi:hypothetical protein
MEAKLTFKYDRESDILHIEKCPPYAEQESEELLDEIIARLNPDTSAVESLDVLFFSTRLPIIYWFRWMEQMRTGNDDYGQNK